MAAASVKFPQLAITSSPLAAAIAFYLTQIAQIPGYEHVSLLNIISVTIPATFCGNIGSFLFTAYVVVKN